MFVLCSPYELHINTQTLTLYIYLVPDTSVAKHNV